MTAFLLFAAIAFLVYEFIAFAQLPRSGVSPLRFGGLTINFDAPTARRWRLGLRILTFFLVLIAILLLHEFGPEATLNRIRANSATIILGLFFGALFAMWINSVFTHSPGTALTKGQIVAGVGLIVLFIVGSVGNELGTLIERLARKASVSNIKIGGTEITFTQTARKTGAESLAVVSSSGGSFGLRVIGSSYGLDGLADLSEAINRDCGYIGLFEGTFKDCSGSSPIQKKLSSAKRFAKLGVSDYARCLNGIYAETADLEFVNERLEPLAPLLRELVGPNFDKQIFLDHAILALYPETVRLTAYVLSAPPKLESKLTDCGSTLMLLCTEAPADPQNWPESKAAGEWLLEEKNEKNAGLVAARDQCRDDAVGLVRKFPRDAPASGRLFDGFYKNLRPQLEQHLEDDFRDRPYAAVAYADLMAHLDHHSAALQVLFQWLGSSDQRKHENPLQNTSDFQPSKIHVAWFEVRARSTIAFFMEEWIRRKEPSVPTALREEHIDNLGKLLELITHIKMSDAALAALDRRRHDLLKDEFRAIRVEAPSDCPRPDAREQQLIHVYLSDKLVLINNALHHPKYDVDLAEDTRTQLERVMNADMSCILRRTGTSGEAYDGYIALRAEALDYEAQILRREAMKKRYEAINDWRDKDRDEILKTTLDTLYLAQSAATLGKKSIEQRYHELRGQRKRATNFIERVSPSGIIDRYELLEANLAAISEAVRQVKENQ
jgi:hypothetical protein